MVLHLLLGTLNVVEPFHNQYGQYTRVCTPDWLPVVLIEGPHRDQENWNVLAVSPVALT